jgi:hypothetical protein
LTRIRINNRTIPSKGQFVKTAQRQHVALIELSEENQRLRDVVRVLHESLRTEQARTLRERIWTEIKSTFRLSPVEGMPR